METIIAGFGGVVLGWILHNLDPALLIKKRKYRKQMKKSLLNGDIYGFFYMFDSYIRKYGIVDLCERLGRVCEGYEIDPTDMNLSRENEAGHYVVDIHVTNIKKIKGILPPEQLFKKVHEKTKFSD